MKPRKLLRRGLMRLENRAATADVEAFPVFCRDLPAAFRMARIAVIADLHLPDAMLSPTRLARCVALQKPDAIFLVGDLTNSYTAFDEDGLRAVLSLLTPIAPCFAIPGNHEWREGREPRYRDILTAAGVSYMCDSYADWVRDGQTLRLFGMGLRKPAPLRPDRPQPSVVLAHKPQYLPYFAAAHWDLVVCGHAHGGQVRLAGQPLFAPGQGVFPTYTSGVYTDGDTTMVVSRGLGNSSVPFRPGNKPHIPLVILLAAPKKDQEGDADE